MDHCDSTGYLGYKEAQAMNKIIHEVRKGQKPLNDLEEVEQAGEEMATYIRQLSDLIDRLVEPDQGADLFDEVFEMRNKAIIAANKWSSWHIDTHTDSCPSKEG